MENKLCVKCKQIKDINSFLKFNGNKVYTYCKTCCSKYILKKYENYKNSYTVLIKMQIY